MRVLLWLVMAYHGGNNEATDLLAPRGWVGNPWGPAATAARKEGKLPPIPQSPVMQQWDLWARKTLKTGDILFRRGDARILHGTFPFSRFLANVSGSQFSHTGTVIVEDGEVAVYDTTKTGVRRQPLNVWILDNAGPFGVKRLKADYRDRIPKVVEYLHKVFREQPPFDYDLSIDDRELYCVEMAEKAFRYAGLTLSEPVLLADMENINQFPICVLAFTSLTSLKLDQPVFFPGNERHGIWSSALLETVYQSPVQNTRTTTAAPVPPVEKDQKPAAPKPKSVAGRPSITPRD